MLIKKERYSCFIQVFIPGFRWYIVWYIPCNSYHI